MLELAMVLPNMALEKISEKEKKEGKLSEFDVSKDIDLIIVIANLIKQEEHFINSFQLTQKEEYLVLSEMTRRIRGELMKIFLKDVKLESDDWCIVKHALSSFYGLREVAQKLIAEAMDENSEEKLKLAKELENYSAQILNLLIEMLKNKKVQEASCSSSISSSPSSSSSDFSSSSSSSASISSISISSNSSSSL